MPGFVGGDIANQVGAGFLGGLVAGLLAGFVVMLIKKVKVPRSISSRSCPSWSSRSSPRCVVGFVMFQVIGAPIRDLMTAISAWLRVMGTGNRVVLARRPRAP